MHAAVAHGVVFPQNPGAASDSFYAGDASSLRLNNCDKSFVTKHYIVYFASGLAPGRDRGPETELFDATIVLTEPTRLREV